MCVQSINDSSRTYSSSEVSPSAPISSHPTSTMTTNPPAMAAPPAPPPRRPVVPYQNVTRNNHSNEFVLEDHFESLAILPNQQQPEQQQEQQQLQHQEQVQQQYQNNNNSQMQPPQQVIHHVHHFYHQNTDTNLRQIQEIIRFNKQKLSESGWYYGQMTWIQSTALLKSTPEGTFLVRDSSDPRFLYTLSVQRGPDEGPTSVRIHFSDGKFRLDAEDKIQNLMPAFTSVVDLVEHYSRQHKSAKSHIWIDMGGQISPSIWLKAPLLKKVPTLAHSARLTVHQNLESQQHQLEDMQRLFKLPYLLTRYLQEYPHKM